MIDLYNGDALKILRGGGFSTPFDAVITDPPYASGQTLTAKGSSTAAKYTTNKRYNPLPNFEGDAMDQRTWIYFMSDLFREARGLCNPGAVLASFTDWRQLPSLSDALQRAGWRWRGVAVWDKVRSRPQKGRFAQQAEFVAWASNGALPLDRPVPCLPGVFHVNGQAIPDRIHQTQKPVELMREIVRICVPGGHILDPFAGSGTTLLAARDLGYSATGIESNRAIAQLAAARLNIELK